MNWRDHIEINPEILVGKPVLKGTRIAVELILEMLAEGVLEKEILANYPRATREGIRACIAYATEIIRSERVYPLGA